MNQCYMMASFTQKKSIIKSRISSSDYGHILVFKKAAIAQCAIADTMTDKLCFSG